MFSLFFIVQSKIKGHIFDERICPKASLNLKQVLLKPLRLESCVDRGKYVWPHFSYVEADRHKCYCLPPR